MLTASSTPPKDIDLVLREIQEIRDALEAFKAAVEAGEMTGYKGWRSPSARWLGYTGVRYEVAAHCSGSRLDWFILPACRESSSVARAPS